MGMLGKFLNPRVSSPMEKFSAEFRETDILWLPVQAPVRHDHQHAPIANQELNFNN